MTAKLDLLTLYNQIVDRLTAEGHPDAHAQAAAAVEQAEQLSDKIDEEKKK